MTRQISLTKQQNAALVELNAALYRAKNSGVLALLPEEMAVDDFYAAVGGLCVQTNMTSPAATFTARVRAVMRDRDCLDKELMAVTMGVSDPDLYHLQMHDRPHGLISHYVVNVCRDGMGEVEITLPLEVENVLEAANEIMFCQIIATFRPQAWIRDYAVDLDDGGCHFNAITQILQMGLPELKEMFSANVDFDRLADGLEQRASHRGPFEVDIDETSVVRLVCLLSGNGNGERLGENGSVSEITQPMWDTFVNTSLALHRLVHGPCSLPGEASAEAGQQDLAPEGCHG